MLDAAGLIEEHRARGVIVDTNLLVLYLVGTVNRQRILNFKRTAEFTLEDYDLLVHLIGWFGKLIATPHVLSQVSDLTDLSGDELIAVRRSFRLLVETIEERFDASRVIVGNPVFDRLGLTDAAVATVSARGILVLTTDLQLQLALQDRDIDVLNFNHVRALEWRTPSAITRRRRRTPAPRP
jgi:hypothetical protein